MDMEWAKDGRTGELFILQARPETVQSRKDVRHARSLPARAAAASARQRPQRRREDRGRPGARHQERANSLEQVRDGRRAGHRQDRSRLGTDHEKGGGNRHQSRRPHLSRGHRQPRTGPAGDCRHRARHRRRSETARAVTVSCAEGETGFVYEGELPFEVAAGRT